MLPRRWDRHDINRVVGSHGEGGLPEGGTFALGHLPEISYTLLQLFSSLDFLFGPVH